MKRAAIAAGLLATALALGGSSCGQQIAADKSAADAAIKDNQTSIALACWGVKALEAVDDGLNAAGKIQLPPNAVAGIAAGRAELDALCTPPYPQNTDDIVKRVLAGSAAISGLLKGL